jgi:hypothetical protein
LDLPGPPATFHLLIVPSLSCAGWSYHFTKHSSFLYPDEGYSRFLHTLLPIYSVLTVLTTIFRHYCITNVDSQLSGPH